MLLITGPGRSGTSMLAQFCQMMGYDPGGAWHDSVNAGLEHPTVVTINDALLSEVKETGATTRTLAARADEMRGLDLAVVKDPRFTIHPALLRAWHSVRPDLTVLVSYRKPEHCLASRQLSAKGLRYRDKTHPDEFRRGLADTLETLLELDIPFELLLFPHFLGQFDRVYAAFQKLGLTMDRDEAERTWDQAVNRDRVHFTPQPQDSASSDVSSGSRKASWNPFARGE